VQRIEGLRSKHYFESRFLLTSWVQGSKWICTHTTSFSTRCLRSRNLAKRFAWSSDTDCRIANKNKGLIQKANKKLWYRIQTHRHQALLLQSLGLLYYKLFISKHGSFPAYKSLGKVKEHDCEIWLIWKEKMQVNDNRPAIVIWEPCILLVSWQLELSS
jgi:hypothetical protein